MTKEEYKLKYAQLEKDFESVKRALKIEYALENNPYKIGDIIKCHHTKVRIEKITTYEGYGSYPECVYTGIQLNKDGTPAKRQNENVIYQSNIITE